MRIFLLYALENCQITTKIYPTVNFKFKAVKLKMNKKDGGAGHAHQTQIYSFFLQYCILKKKLSSPYQ